MNIVLGGSFHDASSLVQSAGNTQKGTNGPPTLPTHEHISIYVFFLSLWVLRGDSRCPGVHPTSNGPMRGISPFFFRKMSPRGVGANHVTPQAGPPDPNKGHNIQNGPQ